MKLKSKLVLSFVLLASIALIVVSSFSYMNMKNQLTTAIDTEMALTANGVTKEFEGWLKNKAKVIETTSTVVENVVKDGMVTKDYLQSFKNDSEIMDIYMGIEEDGHFVDGGDWIAPADYDSRTRAWYKVAKISNGVGFTDPYVDVITGNFVVSAAMATPDSQGNMWGVVGSDISLTKLNEIIHNIKIKGRGYGFLIDQKGIAMAYPEKERITTNLFENEELKDLIKEMLEKDNGIKTYSIGGEEKRIAYEKIPSTSWVLAVAVPTEEIYKPLEDLRLKYMFINGLAIILIILFALYFARYLTKPIKIMTEVAEIISNGDLTMNVKITTKDELGQLSNSFNKMVENLRQLIGHVHDVAENLGASSQEMTASAEESSSMADQMAQTIDDLSKGAMEEAETIRDTSETIDQMAMGIKQISQSTQRANDVGKGAKEASENGEIAMEQAIQTMLHMEKVVKESVKATKDLGENSNEIGKIVQVITGIADQTNLLALNAAIEAARAGEHGRGFAVVAEEVRKLAEESSQAARQIEKLIGEVQQGTNIAVDLMNKGGQVVEEGSKSVTETGKAFDQIHKAIDKMVGEVVEVSEAIEDMANGSGQIVEAMGNIRNSTEESAASTEEAAAATQEQMAAIEELANSSQSLAQMAEELQDHIGQFKI